jgi:hypothetical protein
VYPTVTNPTTRNVSDHLPLELQPFASLLNAQPPEAQEAFQFLLATAMHGAGKFELLKVAGVDGRWHYTYEGADEVVQRGAARDEHGEAGAGLGMLKQ